MEHITTAETQAQDARDVVTHLLKQATAAGLSFTAPGGGKLTITGKPSAQALAIIERVKAIKPAVLAALAANAEQASGWDVVDAELTLDAASSDLVLFVGALVSEAELWTIQARATAAHYTLHAKAAGEVWYIVGLDAGREYGKLAVGYPVDEGNYQYKITNRSPLFNPIANGYKAWLWGQMQSNADVLYELYIIANASYMGCDVYISGPNDSAVMAAVAYILNNEQGPYLLRGDTKQ